MSNKYQAKATAAKKAENAYREMDMVMQQDQKILQMAKFENTTTAKIERRIAKEHFEQKKKQHDLNLYNRRSELADLYNREMEQWRGEVLAKVETQEDRKQRIMARAYELKKNREAQKTDFVKAKYDLQWRDSCDDARNLDSKAMSKFMNAERLRQIEEKKKLKQKLSSQENDFLAEWNRQLDAIEAKDKAKRDYHHKVDMETAALLKEQIDNNERIREEHFYKTRAEEADELDRLRAEIEAEEEKQRRLREERYERGREVMEFNEYNKQFSIEEERIEQEQNKILLDYALRKEAAEIQAEEDKKNAARQAGQQYKKYLELQMIQEAQDNSFVDEVRRREEEKVWKARDDQLQAREDARAYLMKMVDEGRQEQIAARREAAEKARMEDAKFASKFLVEGAEAVQKEREAAAYRRAQAEDNNAMLQKQIEYRRQREELEKQEQYLADKQMKYIERQHQQRLNEQGGTVRLFRPKEKNKWYS